MKTTKLGLPILCTFLTGCVTVRTTDSYFAWRPNRNQEVYLHLYSHFAFPKRLGNFERGQPTLFEITGRDVSVAYDLPNVALTAYIYPSGLSVVEGLSDSTAAKERLSNEFETRKAELVQFHRLSRLVSEEDYILSSEGRNHTGKKACFEFRDALHGATTDLHSLLYLFLHGDHFVKFRITYPKNDELKARVEINRFLHELLWPVDETSEFKAVEIPDSTSANKNDKSNSKIVIDESVTQDAAPAWLAYAFA